MFTLQKRRIDLPKPAQPRAPRRRKYPYNDMEIGDWFFVDGPAKYVGTYAYMVGRDLGKKFSTRRTQMRRDDKGMWQPCEAGDDGAVSGVMVMRTK